MNSMLEDPGNWARGFSSYFIMPECSFYLVVDLNDECQKGKQPACLYIPRCTQVMFSLSSLLWTELCSPKIHITLSTMVHIVKAVVFSSNRVDVRVGP